MSPAPVSSPPEVEEPSVAGLRVRPVWPMVLYVLLVSSAALALYTQRRPVTPELDRLAPWIFLAFAVGFAGYRFALAVALLRELAQVRGAARRGLGLHELAAAVRVDPLQVEPVLDLLIAMDWVARLDEADAQRHILLIDAERTPARALIDALLLGDDRAVAAFRRRAGLDTLTVSALLA